MERRSVLPNNTPRWSSNSRERASGSIARLRRWLDADPGIRAVALTRPGSVAWVTGWVAPPVDRTAAVDLVWAVVTADVAALVTTNVELHRVRDECDPAGHGFEVVAVPWFEPDAFAGAAMEVAGATAEAGEVAADGHPAFARDVTDDLIALRLALSPSEQADLRSLGAHASGALEAALRAWRPGERDLDVQARVAAALEGAGADAPVLIVGADDRVRRYRHPMAVGAPACDSVMAVVVARRGGLHAAATRFACAGRMPPDLAHLRARVLRIERAVLEATVPGATYGDALAALDRAYAREGAPRGWAGHYQGGPIGFQQREFEIAPCDGNSHWYAHPVAPGHAVAWNPSLEGGAKAEDTYVVGDAGILERVTTVGGWPLEPGDEMEPPRPAVLEVDA